MMTGQPWVADGDRRPTLVGVRVAEEGMHLWGRGMGKLWTSSQLCSEPETALIKLTPAVKKETGEINLNRFYLTQSIRYIMSTCNQYKIMMKHFTLFIYEVFEVGMCFAHTMFLDLDEFTSTTGRSESSTAPL